MRVIILLAILVGIICLQIFLSKRDSKWLGLILPIISFLFALLIVSLNMMAPTSGMDMSFILTMVVMFLMFNIPTTIFLAIYYACQKAMGK